jgi:hypothetical protein
MLINPFSGTSLRLQMGSIRYSPVILVSFTAPGSKQDTQEEKFRFQSARLEKLYRESPLSPYVLLDGTP